VMDHRYIEEVDVIDRYLMGRLAAEESAEFESHFVDCEQCIEQLNTTRAFIVGIRSVASEQAVHRIAPGRTYWWTQFTRSRKTLALVASVILVALAVGALLVSREIQRARTEAAQASALAAEWRRRYEDQEAVSASNAQQNPQRERDTQTAGRSDSESNRTDSENVAGTGVPRKPRINVALFVLTSTRGGDPSVDSRNLLRLSRTEDFVISAPLEGETNYIDYRMTLSRNRVGRVWESRGLKADAHNLLTVEFNASAFTSGDYEVTVEGTTRERTTKIIAKYALTVVKSK
jgi:hypothetical protein